MSSAILLINPSMVPREETSQEVELKIESGKTNTDYRLGWYGIFSQRHRTYVPVGS